MHQHFAPDICTTKALAAQRFAICALIMKYAQDQGGVALVLAGSSWARPGGKLASPIHHCLPPLPIISFTIQLVAWFFVWLKPRLEPGYGSVA